MKDFFKYITAGEEDKDWGLYLNVAGKSKIKPNTIYPSAGHPAGYHFSWKKGRILEEYQINYITQGAGILENDYGKFQIKPGTIMITRPDVWHRYRPLKRTGWIEHYIGFNGQLANQFLNKDLFPKELSVIQCSMREEFIDTYYKIFDLVRNEEPGFQQITSGLIIKLLGYIVAWKKKRNFLGNSNT